MYYGYYGWGLYNQVGFFLILIGTVLMFLAQGKVTRSYRKYSKIYNSRGMTGYQVAREILDQNGLQDVRIEHISGELSDHYDPRNKVLRLSNGIYDQTTVAALAVAAHECGHAIQHKEGYLPLTFRNAIIPFCNVGQRVGWFVLFLGLAIANTKIAWIGVFLMCGILLFQIMTLPVEFDASSRALTILNDRYLSDGEYSGAKKMLTAAALTYVASVISTLLSLLRIVLMVIGSSRRDD